MEGLGREPFTQDAVEIDSGFWPHLPVDRRYDRVTYHHFDPQTAIGPTTRTVKFKLPAWTCNNLYMLNDTLLKYKCRIVDSNYSSALPDGSQVAPINYFLLSPFSHVKIWFNDKPVFQSDNLYPFRAYVENELTATSYEKATILKTQGYYDDEEDKFDSKTNDGWEKRANLFSTGSGVKRKYHGEEVFVCGPLNHDFTNCTAGILSGITIIVELTLAPDKFILQQFPPAFTPPAPQPPMVDAHFILTECKLSLPVAEQSDAFAARIIQRWKQEVTLMQYRRRVLNNYTIPSGAQHFYSDTLFPTHELPIRILVGFVSENSFLGDWGTTPFNFSK
jgi:hypothetical protein